MEWTRAGSLRTITWVLGVFIKGRGKYFELLSGCYFLRKDTALTGRPQTFFVCWSKKLKKMNGILFLYKVKGPGSSVGIATELRAGRSGDRIPVRVSFSAPVQTGPGAHPASCTMGTVSFSGVKNGRGVTLTPHHLLVPWS